jgi:hypothetical protein
MTRNEELVAFYYELGMAISHWANVEIELCLTVQACFHEENRPALGVGFFAIENFRSKLEFADHIVRRRLGEDVEGWADAVDKMRKASFSRNKLVHRSAREYLSHSIGRRYALIPWIIKKPRTDKERKKPPPGSLCLRDIIQIRYQFVLAFVSIRTFRARVEGQTVPPLKYPELLGNPPTIPQIRRRIHEVLGHPLKPSRKKS